MNATERVSFTPGGSVPVRRSRVKAKPCGRALTRPALTRIINSFGGRSLHEQSHGESFLALVTERFRGEGLYILDEPEAALSPQRQLAVLSRIHDLVLAGAQFIMATHSPILMAYPDARILQLGAEGIHEIAYEDTEHFQVTRNFLANPGRMLRVLFDRGADDV